MQTTQRPLVFVSILNWNAAPTTLACLASVLESRPGDFDLVFHVVDNGSEHDDWEALRADLPGIVQTTRLAENIGFAAGHNIVLRLALERGADFVWLLNNDTVIPPGTLEQLITFMQQESRCGAVSPLIFALHDKHLMDFCGAWHDWEALESRRPNDAAATRRMEQTQPEALWNHGTAPLFRIDALRDVGLLDERYFAYFEDDDIGVRLARKGWFNRVCHNARIRHARRTSILADRPAYYFYLMARNSFAFWNQHTLSPYRNGIKRRLLCRVLIQAAKLRAEGFKVKSDACLTGAVDGIAGRSGPPRLDSRPPLWLSLASRLPYRFLSPLAS